MLLASPTARQNHSKSDRPFNLSFSGLQLYSNLLSGTMPVELFQNTDLAEIQLDGNSLTGTISENIGDLVKLTDLRIHENSLSGPLPSSIVNLHDLRKFSASKGSYAICLLSPLWLISRDSSCE